MKNIVYKQTLDNVNSEMLNGFFIGWKNPPVAETLYEILNNSEHKVLAIDMENNKVVGFINALSDKILSAYIPLLEVLPEYQRRGIGSELVKRMLDILKNYYMIDLVCDESLEAYYKSNGMNKFSAMIKRNYENQSGALNIRK